MNGTLEQEIKQWADSRWPTRTLASRLRKLGEEVGELAEAVCLLPKQGDVTSGIDVVRCHSHAAREAADCAIILSDICSMLGYSLSAVMREKFAEVQARPVPLSARCIYGDDRECKRECPTCRFGGDGGQL